VERIYTQARELCESLGETPQLFPVLWGLARIYDQRDLNMGREVGEQLLNLAQRAQEPALLLEAHHECWANLFSLGELSSALSHTERVLSFTIPRSTAISPPSTAGMILECAR
jgi:hypothetical protein